MEDGAPAAHRAHRRPGTQGHHRAEIRRLLDAGHRRLSAAGHKSGIAILLLCTVLWSTGGVALRTSGVTNGWEMTFWRSSALSLGVGALLLFEHRGQALARIAAMGVAGVFSSLAWAVMFTAFLLAISLTTVANALVLFALMPFFAAIAGRVALDERVPARTWVAMGAAAVGIALMFRDAMSEGSLAGSLVALAVPLAAAMNNVVVKRSGGRIDLVPALCVGGAIAALVALPFAQPFTAGAQDLALFTGLALFQLALPCILLVRYVVPRLLAAEIGLLCLLEVVLGGLWVWLAFGERPGAAALAGGAIVIVALAANEALALALESRRST